MGNRYQEEINASSLFKHFLSTHLMVGTSLEDTQRDIFLNEESLAFKKAKERKHC